MVPEIEHLCPKELDSAWCVKKIIMDFLSIPKRQDIGGANFNKHSSTGFSLLGTIVRQILWDVKAICQKRKVAKTHVAAIECRESSLIGLWQGRKKEPFGTIILTHKLRRNVARGRKN